MNRIFINLELALPIYYNQQTTFFQSRLDNYAFRSFMAKLKIDDELDNSFDSEEEDDIDENEDLRMELEEKLLKNPKNVTLMTQCALLEMDPPQGDQRLCVALLERILTLEKHNVNALLMLAYVKHNLDERVSDAVLTLLKTLKTGSREQDSMLRFAASWFYTDNKHECERLLRESISLCDGHVWNLTDLAQRYMDQGYNEDAEKLITKALKNAQNLSPEEKASTHNPISIDIFLNERIKGIR